MNSWVFILIIPLMFVSGCDWLDKIKEKKVDFKVLGAGQHRVLHVKTRIVSEQRFLECRLLYEFEIPDGAYIDGDSINSTLINHRTYIKDPFDVEVMQGHAKKQKILVLHSNMIRRSFAIDDSLELPVRIRYHPAKEAALGTPQKANIVFVTPTVALDCPNDYESLDLARCVGKRSYNSFFVPSHAPYWILIEPLSKLKNVVTIPIGNTSDTPVVIVILVCSLLISVYFVTEKPRKDSLISKT